MSVRRPLVVSGHAAARATATPRRQAVLGAVATLAAAVGVFATVGTLVHPFVGVVIVAIVLAIGLTASLALASTEGNGE